MIIYTETNISDHLRNKNIGAMPIKGFKKYTEYKWFDSQS